MNKFAKYSFALILSLGLASAAYAKDKDKDGRDWDDRKPHTAPEIDAALATGGLALVGGTITVLRARRRK